MKRSLLLMVLLNLIGFGVLAEETRLYQRLHGDSDQPPLPRCEIVTIPNDIFNLSGNKYGCGIQILGSDERLPLRNKDLEKMETDSCNARRLCIPELKLAVAEKKCIDLTEYAEKEITCPSPSND